MQVVLVVGHAWRLIVTIMVYTCIFLIMQIEDSLIKQTWKHVQGGGSCRSKAKKN